MSTSVFEETIAAREGKTIYRDGGKTIKIFESGYKTSDILNEALNLARVEEIVGSDIGLNVPKLLEVTKVATSSGEAWAIITEYIPGKTMSELMKTSPDKKDEYLHALIDLQITIQSKEGVGLHKLHDKMKRKINETCFDATTRYELQTRLGGMPKHTKMCHGDFCPSNIIITPDGVPYIIDWAHATQGNASADAARTYLLFNLQGNHDLAEEYLTRYSKRADIARQTIQKWLPIVAASQSVKAKAEEREFLASWVNVVEYE
ncbi:MAG: aminoglycoside phosphotransferase family protein [Oscillospiraceae bacterium]|jgi:tRNA A-37 threonylcarbamoyl transferase component Bud32|nr:aminoglycoside phosphotransferase family protein [Oscillospiraceae bacterium]